MISPEENTVNNTGLENNEESSTIFSAPAEHKDKKISKKANFKRLIAAFAALCIVGGGTAAVVSLIPEKTEESKKSNVTFEVLNIDSANVEKAELINAQGSVTMLSELTESDGSSTVDWQVDGVNKNYTDSSSIEYAVETASVISATKKIEGSEADFGLEEPQASVTLYPRNDAFSTVTVSVGNAAPANMGYYCKISTDENIYLVDDGISELINLTALDFSTTSGLSGVIQTDNNSECFTDGEISDFDYITLSGSKYPKPLKIELQQDETINAYFAFKITSPTVRIGNDDNITAIIDSLSSGISSNGAYCYDPTTDDLKKYGLDNPDVVLTISVAGEKYTIIAAEVSDGYYAVIDTYGTMIHKISASLLTFATSDITDYYSSFIVLENLSGLSHFKLDFANGTSYDFVTEYNEDDETYKAFYNGTELNIDNFKAFYRQFIGLSPVEYDEKELNETALTITLVHSNAESGDTVLKFKPYSAGRYQVEMNGIPMGLITSASYDKLAANAANAANGADILE